MAYFCIRVLVFFIFIASVSAEDLKLKIMHTTDVHCQIQTHRGGWIKLCGVVKDCREKWGEDNTLLIDCGDTIQGSLAAVATRGEVAIDYMNYLRYDAWALGNHELDFGIRRLNQLLDKTKIPVLSGNFSLTGTQKRKFKAYEIYQRSGVKVAVIGMQASFLKHWFIGEDFEEYDVKKVVAVLPAILKEVRKHKPNMTILALHHGFNFSASRGVNEIRDVTRLFPQLDLVLGGHTHQFHPGKNIYGTYYSQAGFHASHLGVVEATFSEKDKKLQTLSSWLVDVDKEDKEDSLAVAVYKKWQQKIDAYGNEFIIDLVKPISVKGDVGGGCQVSALIAASMVAASPANIALHGKFTKSSISGRVTRGDLFKVIPYENNIYVLEVNSSQLFKIMEEQMLFWKKGHFNGPVGFRVRVDPKTKRVESIDIAPQKSYKLAVNSRVAVGGGGRFPYLRSLLQERKINFEEIQVNTRDAVEAYLKNSKEILVFPRSIIEVSP